MINEEKILKEILDTYETEYPTATGAFDEFVTKIIPNIFKNYTSKQKPKNIVYEDGYIQYWNCPNCNMQHVAFDYYHKQDLYSYCPECGQKIDWKGAEKDD